MPAGRGRTFRRRAAVALAIMAGAATVAWAETGVAIDLVFEQGVAETLADRGEWVVLRASYYGEPADASAPVDETGLVYLGEEEATVFPADQRVVLGGAMAAQPRGWVVEPLINVNVFTARFGDENNLLDCGLVDGPVAALAKEVQRISCSLIGAP
jgi:hypothetical protein